MLTLDDYIAHQKLSVYDYSQIDWLMCLLELHTSDCIKDNCLQIRLTDEVKDLINLICKDTMLEAMLDKLNYVENLIQEYTSLDGILIIKEQK